MKPRIRVVPGTLQATDDAELATEEITLAEQAHRALRQDIIAGDLEAGQPLRLEYLKERYGLSFSPIREALNRLKTERLVVSTPSRGFRVAPFSEAEMWDAIETRILIDCEALRRSISRGDDEWTQHLVASFNELTQSASQPGGLGEEQASAQASTLEARHRAFHEALICACGSQWLMDLSAQLYAQTERYRRPSLKIASPMPTDRDVGREHKDLLSVTVARDSVQATGLLAMHYRETGRFIQRQTRLAAEASARASRTG